MLRLYVEIFLSSNIFENDKVIVPVPSGARIVVATALPFAYEAIFSSKTSISNLVRPCLR